MNRQPPQPSSSEQQPFGPPQWGQQAPQQPSGQPPYGQPGQQPPAPPQPPYGQPPSGQPYWGQQPPSQPPYERSPFGNVPQPAPYGQSFYGNSDWGQPPSQPPMSGRNSSLLQQPSSWPGLQPGQFQPPTTPPTMPPQTGNRGPGRKRKTGVKVILGVCILLVVLLASYGVFVALGSRNGPSLKTTTSPSQPAVQVSPTATTALAPTATPTLQPTPKPTPKPTPRPTPTPASKPVTKSVTIVGMTFSPATVTVPVGSTIIWTNSKDNVAHTATATSGPVKFDSKNLDPGKTYRFTFTKAGTYKYDCTYHPFMIGTIIVT